MKPRLAVLTRALTSALAAAAALLCLAAASDPSERLPDPAQEARARAVPGDPLRRLPERVDRRL
jgi:hypothetical protein